MREYLHNFCVDENLANYTGFQPQTFCNVDSNSFSSHGCTIHSVFKAATTIGSSSLVEYCRFDGPLVIGDNCIVSHCSCTSVSTTIHIPSNIFLHTIPVRLLDMLNGPKYVTLVFHIDDNVKFKATGLPDTNLATQLMFLGKPLSEAVNSSVPETKLFATDNSGELNCSLWYARLFAVKSSMDAALVAALSLVNGQKIDLDLEESSEFLSASETVQKKDIHSMLDNVQLLCTSIASCAIETH